MRPGWYGVIHRWEQFQTRRQGRTKSESVALSAHAQSTVAWHRDVGINVSILFRCHKAITLEDHGIECQWRKVSISRGIEEKYSFHGVIRVSQFTWNSESTFNERLYRLRSRQAPRRGGRSLKEQKIPTLCHFRLLATKPLVRTQWQLPRHIASLDWNENVPLNAVILHRNILANMRLSFHWVLCVACDLHLHHMRHLLPTFRWAPTQNMCGVARHRQNYRCSGDCVPPTEWKYLLREDRRKQLAAELKQTIVR